MSGRKAGTLPGGYRDMGGWAGREAPRGEGTAVLGPGLPSCCPSAPAVLHTGLAIPRSCPICLRLARSSDMELEKSMRMYRSTGLSHGSNTSNWKCFSSPGRSLTRSPWGDTWLRRRVVSIWVSCVQERGQLAGGSPQGPRGAASQQPRGWRAPAPGPCSGHLCDLEATLHDHQALLPAARSQQLGRRVAAPLLEHLAGRRRSPGGRGAAPKPWWSQPRDFIAGGGA